MKKRVTTPETENTDIIDSEKAEELSGSIANQDKEDKLMRSVLENDKDTIDEGKLLNNAINQGISSFSPDMMFEQLVNNYSLANQIYGPSLIRLISGYNPDYIEKNINIPEFRKEIKEKINKKIEELKDKNILDKENTITEQGIELASLVTYFEELEKITPKGMLGKRIHKKQSIYGSKEDVRHFKTNDRYRDIAVKKSVNLAIRRGHKEPILDDLKIFERQSKGKNYIIYAMDASGSMKGEKLGACKRAGIALAFKAIEEKDKVGVIAFGSEIKEVIEPTTDFKMILKGITKIKASKQTDIVNTIRKAVDVFPNEKVTKHLIIITDALPNIGNNPEKETLQEVSIARDNGITVSLIGIKLDEKGRKLAKKITELGQGRLYIINDIMNIDRIVLEDYYGV